MSTIAYRDGVLAADTGVFNDGTCVGNDPKIYRLNDGRLVGAVGDCSEAENFLKWLERGAPDDKSVVGENFEAIVIKPDQTVEFHDKAGRHTYTAPYYVMGADEELALGAMAAGAGPEQAVEIAIKHGRYTRGPVMVLHIDRTFEDYDWAAVMKEMGKK